MTNSGTGNSIFVLTSNSSRPSPSNGIIGTMEKPLLPNIGRSLLATDESVLSVVGPLHAADLMVDVAA